MDIEANEDLDFNSDVYQLGLHLHFDHGLTKPEEFDRFVIFGIRKIANPTGVDKKEYRYTKPKDNWLFFE